MIDLLEAHLTPEIFFVKPKIKTILSGGINVFGLMLSVGNTSSY